MENKTLEEATRVALLNYIELLKSTLMDVVDRQPKHDELKQENTKLQDTITRQNQTISDLSREVLDLKRRLSAHTGEPS